MVFGKIVSFIELSLQKGSTEQNKPFRGHRDQDGDSSTPAFSNTNQVLLLILQPLQLPEEKKSTAECWEHLFCLPHVELSLEIKFRN